MKQGKTEAELRIWIGIMTEQDKGYLVYKRSERNGLCLLQNKGMEETEWVCGTNLLK